MVTQIIIKNKSEIEGMRKACQLAARTLGEAAKLLRPGLSTQQIDDFVHQYTLAAGARPAPLNYHGFPKSVCTSVNEVICHGIPGPRVLQNGDIINIDVTSVLHGWHGDVSATFLVGEVSDAARALVKTTRESLMLGIRQVKPSARIGDIAAAIQEFVEARGYSVVRDFVGHGLGRQFHEPPQVPHYGRRGSGARLKTGMTFTIEPMVNEGVWQLEILKDGWTAVTADGKLSAQFEHTILVTPTGCEVLTAFEEPLVNSVSIDDEGLRIVDAT
ncbi:MAG: type I methionyl aminopeptidase [Myxococcota bacterium]|nr:type I methionyl aminopeptidase [Myxococcota bacterium]